MYKKIIQRLKIIFSSKCPFRYECPYYQSKGFTCNHPTAEDGYCGKYREFMDKINLKQKLTKK